MIAVLSPAKSLDYENEGFEATATPTFRKKSADLVSILKEKNIDDLRSLMHISEKLATENYDRYQNFSSRYTPNNSKAAISAFVGDVYVGFDAKSLTQKDIDFANDHIRILSGLYGLLRPLDKMQPYRLEMGTKLKNQSGKNLYEFWDGDITKQINKDLKKVNSEILVNLASNEYFKSIKKDQLKAQIINVDFREYKGDELKFISFNAKKARGIMARYIVQNRILKVDGLKGFDIDDYRYEESLSTEDNLMFVR
jgi:cytoplasmic iron level regulating protein YaaA (DUF328/UPF0246 family)